MSAKQGATGYALGVALSGGGGFRGMAHIGVLRELERRDLGPDFIAGTRWRARELANYLLAYSVRADLCRRLGLGFVGVERILGPLRLAEAVSGFGPKLPRAAQLY
jgi:hypothetical protein